MYNDLKPYKLIDIVTRRLMFQFVLSIQKSDRNALLHTGIKQTCFTAYRDPTDTPYCMPAGIKH